MPTNLVRLPQSLIILFLPLLLIIGAVQLVTTDPYLALEYSKVDFPPDPFCFTTEQRLTLASANFRYVREGQPLEALTNQRLNGAPLYNERELKHMQDVQATYQAVMWVWRFALFVIALSVFSLAWRAETRASLAAALKWAGLLAIGLVGGVGLLAVIAWQFWFVAFHQIFFVPGTWMFNEWDTLIRLFSERFWFDAALTISGLTLIGGSVIAGTAWIIQTDLPATSARVVPAGVRASTQGIFVTNKHARLARQRARARRQTLRAVAFAVIVIGVLGLAGGLQFSAFFRAGPPPLAGNVIDVSAHMGGFDKKEIRVRAGEAVTIRLTSLDNSMHTDGGGKHQWAVDELNVSVIAPPLGSDYATFTPDRPGTYTFYCDICCGGRANPTMQGTLIVEG